MVQMIHKWPGVISSTGYAGERGVLSLNTHLPLRFDPRNCGQSVADVSDVLKQTRGPNAKPINLSGADFDTVMKVMLQTPPPKGKKPVKSKAK